MTMALKKFLESDGQKTLIEQALPVTAKKYLTADKITRIALIAAHKTPLIGKCTHLSILQSVIDIASLGLEPGGPLGHAYLVPFKCENKETGRWEYICTPIVGYRGFINLARRSGEISTVVAHAVYEKDEFEVDLGSGEAPRHVPYLKCDRGEVYCFYCLAVFLDGTKSVDVMTMDEIEKVKQRSQSGKKNSGPWVTDPIEMGKKTVVRRASKYWPLSTEAQHEFSTGLQIDNKDYAIQLENRGDDIYALKEPELLKELPDMPAGLDKMRPDKLKEFYVSIENYALSIGCAINETPENPTPDDLNVLYETAYEQERRQLANKDIDM